ncbi:hypothetical protein GCM10010399_80960 [Dactylosporangium fulvum]|uniref:DUF397 domain-containing protein n=1 Tax=Dactylosporangium fulvum TaxID=53359 RepID=A0ABY5VVT1_9ACTN|nr:DUF397 domain-containing protein [Dactylosporangium fulvum]UWP81169.1 DUF397 domain-containing protein [Dactylosporangium fulvum]
MANRATTAWPYEGDVVTVEPPERNWHKSSRSNSGNCVEVAIDGASVLVRDSKDIDGPVLRFGADEWIRFLTGLGHGIVAEPAGESH